MIEVEGLSARLGSFALRDVSFTVQSGRYGVVIGPAGSGKTTLLETIAGIIPPTSGDIRLHGAGATRLPARARKIGLVYQHGYLFPHLSVRENIAYGADSAADLDDLIDRIGARDLLGRDVRELSGGERQLVAITRALAPRPGVLLLDEPFSALDPRRRALVRREVRQIHREWGTTVLQVTHDFAEAGMLGDVAILLDAGRVLQSGPPEEVFRKPKSPYIAEFLGAENVFQGEIRFLDESEAGNFSPSAPAVFDSASEPGGSLPGKGHRAIEFRAGPIRIYTVGDAAPGNGYAVIRAEEVVIGLQPSPSSMRNSFGGVIVERVTLGALTRVTLDVNGVPIVASLTTRSAEELNLREGERVWASFKAMAVHLC